ncbi:MAG TPA: ABC transporter ATP-binding protein [Burkholderiales bacterium]|jgi:branched-chain amino acid transport system ATP-binding protein|nr:ABC transporter ATP-binding protein [Burkholderiales bacterium]
MLEVRDATVTYGAAPAVSGVSLRLEEGELGVIVGPNGAGKTTLINALAGLHPLAAGALVLAGRDLSRLPRHRFCEQGIALVPEGRRLFSGMSVRENLELGAYRRAARERRAQSLDTVLGIFPVLRDRLGAPAGALSGGQQQMLAIARAMMACPRLLLLDEPSLGLAPSIVIELFRVVRHINASGVAVLLVEQNVAMALELARRAYVLEEGRIVAEGPPGELRGHPHIERAYLGR